MDQVRCQFCHEFVDEQDYAAHRADHERLLPDGQQTDHATLPAENREQGDLFGVPRVYLHKKCGGATEMPEEIIRSYLKDPYMHSDLTFCAECGEYVPLKECVWTETGEDVLSYKQALRRSMPELNPEGRYAKVKKWAAVIVGLILGLTVAYLLDDN